MRRRLRYPSHPLVLLVLLAWSAGHPHAPGGVHATTATAAASSTPTSSSASATGEATLTPSSAEDPSLSGGEDIRAALRRSQAADEDATFYMCPPPSGATIVRMAPPRQCPSYSQGRNFTEGMGVLFKENIAPYKFKAHIYYKDIIVTTTWSGSTYAQITNQYSDRAPVPVEEVINLIDKKGKCLSKAEYLRSNREVTAFDKDLDPREVKLKPSKFNTNGSRGWHTTDEAHVTIGSPGIYRTGTTVNCIVEEVDGRSTYPYDSFALSTGHLIFMSPFFGLGAGASAEHNSYALKRFRQVDGYQTRDLDTGAYAPKTTRNFLTTQAVTVAWNWTPKTKSVCSLTKWRAVEEAIRDETNDTFRFTAKNMAYTFVGSRVPLDLDRVHLSQCVLRDANATLEEIYKRRYNRTHVRVGPVETYLVRGGLVLAYQPMVSNELATLYLQELVRRNASAVLQNTRVRRAPRAAQTPTTPAKGGAGAAEGPIQITSVSNIEFAALQFAYDRIQEHVNEMFARVAAAWCQLQNKEQTLWREVAQLNPSAVASAMLEKKTVARLLGDVMAVSHCAPLAGRNVFIQNSMRNIFRPGTCYSRPLVSFSYRNDTEAIEGQLGAHNELLIERALLEPCVLNHKRYFLFGDRYVYYENYTYVRTVPTAEVETISAYVDLNLTMLEDHEFLPAEVYTRAELADTGLLDYEEIQRRQQLHALKFSDIDKVVKVDHNLQIMRGMANFFQGLGDAGQAVGKVVLGAAGAVLSTVTGIASFLSNPFGALALGLLVVAGLVAAFLAYRYVMRLKANPMKALYPVTTRSLKEEAKGRGHQGADGEKGDPEEDDDDIDEDKLALAREMIKYMTIVSSLEQAEHKAKKGNHGPALISSQAMNKLLRRRRRADQSSKYRAVPTTPPDAIP